MARRYAYFQMRAADVLVALRESTDVNNPRGGLTVVYQGWLAGQWKVDNQMKGNAGVWIDHRRAVLVMLNSGEERLMSIASGVEKHPERSGDSPMKGSYEAAQVPADDVRQRTLTAELDIYYDAVIAALHDAESIFIFGPGEAKSELRKRLIGHKLGGLVAGVETQDKMTDRQIAAMVRSHFAKK